MPNLDIRLAARGVIVRNDAMLMVEFIDENGLHYNIPGGGVNIGETLRDAVFREVKEETSVEVTVEELLFVYEHIQNAEHIDHAHVISFFFRCHLPSEAEPNLPTTPDPNQIAVRWIPIDEVSHINLYPLVNDLLLQSVTQTPPAATFVETRPL